MCRHTQIQDLETAHGLIQRCGQCGRVMEDTMTNQTAVQHTPGPWTTNGSEVYARGVDLPVAKIGNPYWPVAEPADVANARLIASAPDLLAALEAMVEMQEAYERRDELTLEARSPRIAAARAAIRRARGED